MIGPRENYGITIKDCQSLHEKIRVLSPDRIHEVEDFVDFLRLADEDRRLIREAAKLSEDAFPLYGITRRMPYMTGVNSRRPA
jgi:hypothetical protein